MAEADVQACMICMDDAFNKSSKAKTECLFCHEAICRACLKTCLLSDRATDVCCPGCHAAWNQDFLIANLPAAFRNKDLKTHRENVLFEREKARIPAYMDDARRYKVALDTIAPLKEELSRLLARHDASPVAVEFKKLRNEYFKAQAAWFRGSIPRTAYEHARSAYYTVHFAYRKNVDIKRLREEIIQIKRQIRPYWATIRSMGANTETGTAESKSTNEARRRIIMPCPSAACAGFVDTLWKCGICELRICKSCRRSLISTDAHECNADDVATALALAKESKPCPKCAAAISKVSGCDQMWCTMCHTTFSWNTGKIETSAIIHNPHYFQWKAASGNAIPRADLPGLPCDINDLMMRRLWREVANSNIIRNHAERVARRELIDTIALRHRLRLDLEAGTLRRTRDSVRDYMADEWRRRLCIRRLVGAITEAEWKCALQRAEKAHHKERAWLQLMEMYALTTRDILGRFAMEETPDLQDIITQHDKLLEFVNAQSAAIGKAYNCKVIKLTPDTV